MIFRPMFGGFSLLLLGPNDMGEFLANGFQPLGNLREALSQCRKLMTEHIPNFAQ
ncbi:hypothetical protein HED49_23935 [Ochrobactrum daejeonense]|nr:hypothetical protein [Brucella daejeonensis]